MVPGLAVVGHNADSGTYTREQLVKLHGNNDVDVMCWSCVSIDTDVCVAIASV